MSTRLHWGTKNAGISMLGIAILLVAASPAAAEPCLATGNVVAKGGNPVKNALVVTEPGMLSTRTDARGEYCLEQLPAEAFRLRVIAEGFTEVISERLDVDADSLRREEPLVTFDAHLEPGMREEVVVTGTRRARKLADSPVRVEVISRDELESVEARTVADAVEVAPGVRVESNCQNCNFSQVRMLGLEGAYSQILVDGQPMYSSLASVYGIEQIPARFVERLEVVKGGGSALYGPGAVAGVINVIPRDPERTGGTGGARVSWLDGNPNTSLNGAFDWVSPSSDTLFTVYGQEDDIEPYDRTGDGYSELGLFELSSYGARFVQYMSDRDVKLSLDLARIEENRRGGNAFDRPVDEADIAEAVQAERTSLSARLQHRLSPRLDYEITASHVETERDSYYGAGQDPNAFGFSENPLTNFDARMTRTLRDGALTWGAGYTRDTLRDSQPAYDRFIDETYTNVGVFGQIEHRLGDRWEIVGGTRIDDSSEIDGLIASPRLAVLYEPGPYVRLRASVASGFRTPQIFDEDLHIAQVNGEGFVLRNDPALEEETSLSTMLGIEWMPKIGTGMGRLEANVFRTSIHDTFNVIERDDPSTTEQIEAVRINAGGGEVYGLELNGSLQLSRVTFGGGIVWQRALFDEEQVIFEDTPGAVTREFLRTPELYGTLQATIDVAARTTLGVGARYTGPMKAAHAAGFIAEDRIETTPSFVVLDTRVAHTFSIGGSMPLEIAVGVKNLTDAYQDDLDQGPDRDAAYVYGPRLPRQFYTSLRLDF